MLNTKLLDFGVPLVVLVAATALIAVTGADLKAATFFYINGAWPVGDAQPWHFLYLYGHYPAYILGGAALALYVAGFAKSHLATFRKGAAFMVILLLLGPGLLVNAAFKDCWGRPRPREVAQFGGKRAFHSPWERGIPGNGKSFPSGHGASAFYLAMPYFALRRRSPRIARRIFVLGMLYGIVMGVARVSQGGHFVSDILWAWGVVHLTAVALYYLMGLDRETAPAGRG
ncbi:phosphatase PAP2 family protein [Geobacter sp. FeAm09]|uniref:phosphatase PAP2 family protein n=1 Tax=Geobacter sp. FeAm09 TaxID=2597769 RepID=UPI0011ECA207|nr:phosphatase PAP2 family protein [Geobacter sp. FeAm09]QEM67226.1 phosphatase PAP2 family protein [Geobacter sp. FeAm09]